MLRSLQSSLEALQRQNSKLRLAIQENVYDSEKMMNVEQKYIAKYYLPNSRAGNPLDFSLLESQRKFIVRVESDVDLISTLLH